MDTFHDPDSREEKTAFQENVDRLLTFSASVKAFECKDIKKALTELMEANKRVEDLREKLKLAEEKSCELHKLFCKEGLKPLPSHLQILSG